MRADACTCSNVATSLRSLCAPSSRLHWLPLFASHVARCLWLPLSVNSLTRLFPSYTFRVAKAVVGIAVMPYLAAVLNACASMITMDVVRYGSQGHSPHEAPTPHQMTL